MKSILRQAKNTVYQFSEIECKVREATSNDSWGASTSQMAEIAKATNNYQDYPQLFAMLWKRLNDVEHIMHVQKALILVEYLLRNGADRFINDAKRRARDIAQLKKYKHYDQNNQDDAKEARAKAKIVYDMLMDDAKLQEERAKALKIRDVRLTGFGSDGGSRYAGHEGGYGGGGAGGRGSGDYSYGNGSGTVAAPARRRKDSTDDADPFDENGDAPAPKKASAKEKAPAGSTPDTEQPVKKKKKKKVATADADGNDATPDAVKLEAPAADGKKKKKKKKAVEEESKEAEGDDFDNPFSNGNGNGNGQASASYAAQAGQSSFVDDFADAVPVAFNQQPQQDIDILTGRTPLSLQTSGDLVDIFSSPTPASPMNQQKLQQIAQQPFDPLGRDPNYRPSPEQKAIEGPKDLWGQSDLMNLNDITKSTAKAPKKLAQSGPTMAQLRAQNPSATDSSFSNLAFASQQQAAPIQQTPFAAPPQMYPNAAPMGMGMGMGMGYPPLHQQMAGMNMGYAPPAAGYGYGGYQQPQPMLALMPPSAYQSGPPALMPPGPSTHTELPFAVQPGSRPVQNYNNSKPVIFDVVSAQKVAQAQADPHYNYNTQQRVTQPQRPQSNMASNW